MCELKLELKGKCKLKNQCLTDSVQKSLQRNISCF